MMRHLLIGALTGGIIGGLAVGIIQEFMTTPLILHAETFETAAVTFDNPLLMLTHGGNTVGEGGGFDSQRLMLTMIANVGAALGFVFMLLGAMTLRGEQITARRALIWAGAAFAATGLLPAFGLAPELPGSAAADVLSRQLWWAMTAVMSVGAFWLIAFGRAVWAPGLALVLLVFPHILGAPVPEVLASKVPAEVAAEFSARALVIQALMWAVPAVIAGYVIMRMGDQQTAAG